MTDRYFDHLGARFAQRIYDSPKGAIRLAVLQRDLQQWRCRQHHHRLH